MKNQFDQYNKPIPQDLTLLDADTFSLSHLNVGEKNKIVNLDWFCFEGNRTNYIFVSQSKLEEVLGGLIDNSSPDDISSLKNLIKVDSVLKRWNEIDGFYWV